MIIIASQMFPFVRKCSELASLSKKSRLCALVPSPEFAADCACYPFIDVNLVLKSLQKEHFVQPLQIRVGLSVTGDFEKFLSPSQIRYFLSTR